MLGYMCTDAGTVKKGAGMGNTSLAATIVADDERRDSTRKDADEYALTLLQGSENAIACVVKDISDTGARIMISADCFVPKLFKLCIPERDVIAECEYVWREGDEIGLRFRNVVDMG